MPNHPRYTGMFPIAPTPFRDNGDLDLDGQRRVLDCMIDQKVDGICILANYSEQFLLTDQERDVLLGQKKRPADEPPAVVPAGTRHSARRSRKF